MSKIKFNDFVNQYFVQALEKPDGKLLKVAPNALDKVAVSKTYARWNKFSAKQATILSKLFRPAYEESNRDLPKPGNKSQTWKQVSMLEPNFVFQEVTVSDDYVVDHSSGPRSPVITLKINVAPLLEGKEAMKNFSMLKKISSLITTKDTTITMRAADVNEITVFVYACMMVVLGKKSWKKMQEDVVPMKSVMAAQYPNSLATSNLTGLAKAVRADLDYVNDSIESILGKIKANPKKKSKKTNFEKGLDNARNYDNEEFIDLDDLDDPLFDTDGEFDDNNKDEDKESDDLDEINELSDEFSDLSDEGEDVKNQENDDTPPKTSKPKKEKDLGETNDLSDEDLFNLEEKDKNNEALLGPDDDDDFDFSF